MKKITKEALIDALNRMDEFACVATEDNDNGEAQQLDKDYKMLFAFIKNAPIAEIE